MKTSIQLVTNDDLDKISLLAKEIWEEHYGKLFNSETANILIDSYHNKDTIQIEIQNGFKYYFVKMQNITIGYFSFQEREDSLFCGKLYLAKEFRRLGLGKEVFRSMEKEAVLLNKSQIILNVNVLNEKSVMFYKSQGMKIIDTVSVKMNDTLTCDDFVMSKDVCALKKAVNFYHMGYNCCQSILMAFAPFFEMKAANVIKLGLAFGNAHSTSSNVCGCISAIGIIVGHIDGDTFPESKKKIYPITKELSQKFEAKLGSKVCLDVIKKAKNIESSNETPVDIEKLYKSRPCAKVVEHTTQIILEYLQFKAKVDEVI